MITIGPWETDGALDVSGILLLKRCVSYTYSWDTGEAKLSRWEKGKHIREKW